MTDGSLTQSIDCDPNVPNFSDEMLIPDAENTKRGCAPVYKVNSGETCPKKTDLWAMIPAPLPCVVTSTGAKTALVAALNERILGSSKPTQCTNPNKWGPPATFDRTDPRLVKVFLTPYASFSDTSGQTTYPVTGFAGFYITGWGGTDNPCTTQGDESGPSGTNAYMVGHFVDYVDPVNNGQAGEEGCESSSLAVCVGVLTR